MINDVQPDCSTSPLALVTNEVYLTSLTGRLETPAIGGSTVPVEAAGQSVSHIESFEGFSSFG